MVAYDVAHDEHGADHPPLLEVVEELVGDGGEAQLGRVVGPVVLQIEGEHDRAHGATMVRGRRRSAANTPSARSRWKTQLRATEASTIIATSIGTR